MVIFAMLIGRALESASAPALARPPFSATCTAHRRVSGAHQHWSPSHSQWLVVSGQRRPADAVSGATPTPCLLYTSPSPRD